MSQKKLGRFGGNVRAGLDLLFRFELSLFWELLDYSEPPSSVKEWILELHCLRNIWPDKSGAGITSTTCYINEYWTFIFPLGADIQIFKSMMTQLWLDILIWENQPFTLQTFCNDIWHLTSIRSLVKCRFAMFLFHNYLLNIAVLSKYITPSKGSLQS